MARGVRHLLLLVLLVALAGAALWGMWRQDALLPAFGLGEPVTLYFAAPDATHLVVEVRYVLPGQASPLGRLRLLAEGPRQPRGAAPVVPPGARPLSVRIDGDTAVADWSGELVTKHWGGTSGELMTVYGIVNTLGELPGVRRVRILVDGKPLTTLAGHLDLTEPLEPDRSLVAPPPGSEGQPGTQMPPRMGTTAGGVS